jgi:AcrR family transcriptional regulator
MARGPSTKFHIQREQILAEAARQFAARGYPGTSMSELAESLGTSKANLYYYVRDKYRLLVDICENHIERLEAVVRDIERQELAPEPRLRELVLRFVQEYGSAQSEHRVLTEDVKFLNPEDRERIVEGERRVVLAFATALSELRPGLDSAGLTKPLTMLLFGMINWMFTWLKPDGTLTHEDMAPIVADLLFGGIGAVRLERGPEPAGKSVSNAEIQPSTYTIGGQT